MLGASRLRRMHIGPVGWRAEARGVPGRALSSHLGEATPVFLQGLSVSTTGLVPKSGDRYRNLKAAACGCVSGESGKDLALDSRTSLTESRPGHG